MGLDFNTDFSWTDIIWNNFIDKSYCVGKIIFFISPLPYDKTLKKKLSKMEFVLESIFSLLYVCNLICGNLTLTT